MNKKILSIAMLVLTIGISFPSLFYGLVQVQKEALSALPFCIVPLLLILACKRVMNRLTPGWPKWINYSEKL